VALGYSVVGCRLDMVHPLKAGDIDAVMDVAGCFDAVQDVPWAALYKELDEAYPGSRFILTEREEQAWLRSALRHFGQTDIPLHAYLYGTGVMRGNEGIYLERYRRHNEEVKEYFAKRSSDLLVLDFSKGHGWRELCGFLDCPVPDRRFPHANKGPQSYNLTDRSKSVVRAWLPSGLRRSVFNCRQRIRDVLGKPDPRNIFNNMVENRSERKRWERS